MVAAAQAVDDTEPTNQETSFDDPDETVHWEELTCQLEAKQFIHCMTSSNPGGLHLR